MDISDKIRKGLLHHLCSSPEKRENLFTNCEIILFRRSPMAAAAVLQVQPLSSVFHIYRILYNCEYTVTILGNIYENS